MFDRNPGGVEGMVDFEVAPVHPFPSSLEPHDDLGRPPDLTRHPRRVSKHVAETSEYFVILWIGRGEVKA